MLYGMTWEQYWFGNPWMAKDFEQYYLLKRRMNNEELWLGGLYVYRAVYAVIASAFGNRSERYLTNPLDFLPKTKLEKKQEEIEKRNKVINFFDSLARMKKAKQSNKGVDENGEPRDT